MMPDLPTETWVTIFSFLDIRTLLRCCLLSIRFNTMIKETPQLQYMIQLNIWAYEDVPQSRMSVMDRIESLRTAQRAWQSPICRVSRKQLEIPDYQATTSNTGVIIFTEYYFVANEGRSRINLFYVDDVLGDTRQNGNPLHIEKACFDVYVDLTQNLLVTVEKEGDERISVNFRTLSTWRPFPRAERMVLDLPSWRDSELDDVYTKCISGDYILLGRDTEGFLEMRLYHWPTTTFVKSWECSGAIMVSDQYIICANYRRESGGYQPFLEVWSVPSQPTTASILLATYLFPFFRNYTVSPLQFRISFWRHGAQKHCFNTPRYTILNISLEDHELFVPLSTFVRSHSAAPTPYVEHPWTEWGPHSTRIFHFAASVASCGYHVLLTDEILDFNPRIKDASSSSLRPSRHQCTMNSPNCVEWHQCGSPALPYNSVPCNLPSLDGSTDMFLCQTKEGPKLLLFYLRPREAARVNIVSL